MNNSFFENLSNIINVFDIIVLIIFITVLFNVLLKDFSLSLISFMKWVLSTIVTIILFQNFNLTSVIILSQIL